MHKPSKFLAPILLRLCTVSDRSFNTSWFEPTRRCENILPFFLAYALWLAFAIFILAIGTTTGREYVLRYLYFDRRLFYLVVYFLSRLGQVFRWNASLRQRDPVGQE